MKKKGCVSSLGSERAADLWRAYTTRQRNPLEMNDREPSSSMEGLYKRLADSPASRFWVSPHRAAAVVGRLLAGRTIPPMHPGKKAMFEEIARRTLTLMRTRPGVPLLHIVEEVIMQPAPSFYLSSHRAKSILIAHRKWLKTKRKS